MPQYPLLVGDVVEIRLCGSLAGQRTINVFHYTIGGGTPQSNDTQALMTAFNDSIWAGGIAPCVSQDLVGVFMQLQTIAPVRKVVDEQVASPTVGDVATAACPPTNTVVLAKRTALAGAQNRGRVYIPGIPFASVALGELISGVTSEWENAADLLAAPLSFNGKTASPVLYSTKDNVTRGPITDGTTDFILRSQRRREVGRGI